MLACSTGIIFFPYFRRTEAKAKRARSEREFRERGRPPFSSPEAALLLVSTENRNLWKSITPKSLRFTNFLSLCACSRSVLTTLIGWKYETITLRMLRKLDPIRDRESWCCPKGERPLGTRMEERKKVAPLRIPLFKLFCFQTHLTWPANHSVKNQW